MMLSLLFKIWKDEELWGLPVFTMILPDVFAVPVDLKQLFTRSKRSVLPHFLTSSIYISYKEQSYMAIFLRLMLPLP